MENKLSGCDWISCKRKRQRKPKKLGNNLKKGKTAVSKELKSYPHVRLWEISLSEII